MEKHQLGVLEIDNAIPEIINLVDWIKYKPGAVMKRSQFKDNITREFTQNIGQRQTQKFPSM